jgi:hypothetical protein
LRQVARVADLASRTVTGSAGGSRSRLTDYCGHKAGNECKGNGKVYKSCFRGRIPPENRNLMCVSVPERQRISVTVVMDSGINDTLEKEARPLPTEASLSALQRSNVVPKGSANPGGTEVTRLLIGCDLARSQTERGI